MTKPGVWTIGFLIVVRFRAPSSCSMSLGRCSIEHSKRSNGTMITHSDSRMHSSTLADAYDIDAVLSFDDDFDGLVKRLDPTTVGH